MDRPPAQPRLSVILCVYNEMGRIQPAIEDLEAALDGREDETEILLIDNGSTDGTREWLRALDRPRYRFVYNERNLGKGGSIRKAIALSRGRYVVIHDPDMEYRAADIWPLLDAAEAARASLGLGSRLIDGRIRYTYLQNYFGVWFLSSLIRLLFRTKVTDAATAMKLLEGDLARNLDLHCHGFDLDFEIVTHIARLGGAIVETPVDYFPRTTAEGKKIRAVRDGVRALRAILRDWAQPKHRMIRQAPPAAPPAPTSATGAPEPQSTVDAASAGGSTGCR